MQKILVIGSDLDFLSQLKKYLQDWVSNIDQCQNLEQAYQFIEKNLYNIVVIHIIDSDELDFIEYLSQESFGTKLFTICDNFSNVILFKAGADDCVSRLTPMEEIGLRIIRLLKFSKKHSTSCLRANCLELYPETGLLKVRNKKVTVRRREVQILSCLINYKNQVVTRNTLIRYVWGSSHIPTHTTVDVYIRRLRLLLPNPKIIQTVRGFGYMIRD